LITKLYSIRVEHDARLGRKFVLLDALYGCKKRKEFAGKEALAYWENVDLYIGGNERNRTFIVLVFGINF
jgi:hypothetical protein